MRILMMVANSVYRDPRVTKEARTLSMAGHNVTIAGLFEDVGNCQVRTSEPFDVRLFRPVKPDHLLRRVRRILGGVFYQAPRRERGSVCTSGGSSKKAPQILRSLNAHILFKATEASFLNVLGELGDLKPDVVHAHDLNTLGPAIRLAKEASIPVVYDAHEIWPELGNYHDWYKRWARSVESRYLREGVTRVITVSDSIADLMRDRYGIQKPCVIINSPPIESNVGTQHTKNSKRDEIVLLYHGALTAGRGLESLIEAFAFTTSNCRLIIRGSGPLRATLQSLIERMRLCRVQIADPVPPKDVVFAAFQDADVGVIPFVTDSLNNQLALPNKLFEYMAAELAIFSVDIPEVSRICRRFNCGVLYDCTSPIEMARSIDALVSDREKLHAMQENSHKAFVSELSWNRYEPRLVAIYESIA